MGIGVWVQRVNLQCSECCSTEAKPDQIILDPGDIQFKITCKSKKSGAGWVCLTPEKKNEWENSE